MRELRINVITSISTQSDHKGSLIILLIWKGGRNIDGGRKIPYLKLGVGKGVTNPSEKGERAVF